MYNARVKTVKSCIIKILYRDEQIDRQTIILCAVYTGNAHKCGYLLHVRLYG